MAQAPEMVQAAHAAFVAAGADVITTNSYALVPFHLGQARFDTGTLPWPYVSCRADADGGTARYAA
jgi:hypothetical protein